MTTKTAKTLPVFAIFVKQPRGSGYDLWTAMPTWTQAKELARTARNMGKRCQVRRVEMTLPPGWTMDA
jgi:hypothetical protein